ncbi:unnamed protein product [Cylicocyclus nassatus]|uniref:Uncharacterized protein n=1 Tax=Cylicocyclus nassatus TaxID=53992 RepID=A0AA36MAY5_CYLNA|nr:unnamed protein product [Cylicocyclus nassatus]
MVLSSSDVEDEHLLRILLSLLTFSQLICTIFEWIGAIYTLAAEHVIRSECFRLIFTYVFTHCIQMGLFATIAVDLLNSIIIPLR